MTIQERYKQLGRMPVNHMNVAHMACGCCLHPHLQVDVIGSVQRVSRISAIRKMSMCRDHAQSSSSRN